MVAFVSLNGDSFGIFDLLDREKRTKKHAKIKKSSKTVFVFEFAPVSHTVVSRDV